MLACLILIELLLTCLAVLLGFSNSFRKVNLKSEWNTRMCDIINEGMHEYLDDFQRLNQISSAIYNSFFSVKLISIINSDQKNKVTCTAWDLQSCLPDYGLANWKWKWLIQRYLFWFKYFWSHIILGFIRKLMLRSYSLTVYIKQAGVGMKKTI
jgi:hypothetical protein